MVKPESFSLGKIELVASLDPAEAPVEQDPGTPFHIAVLGDFSGRARRGRDETGQGLAGRRLLRIDRDDFDRVLEGLGPELRLPVEGEGDRRLVLRFQSLEDFHPDRIYEQADVFQVLKELRQRLKNPATFEAALRQMGVGGEPSPGSGPRSTGREPHNPTPAAPAPPPENLLDQILAETQGRGTSAGSSREAGPLTDFLERITASSRATTPDPRQAEYVARVDEATGELMREILHHPSFQELESAWRSLDFLVRRLETGERLTVSLLDVSKDELAADLGAAEDLRATGIYRRLVESTVGTPGAEPWAVLIGALTFEPTEADLALLGRLAEVARDAGAPFLAAAGPRFLGHDSLAEVADAFGGPREIGDPAGRTAWEALRHHPDAAYLGLALPRFLLRLPYGREDDPIDSFDFEERAPDSDSGSYLWGHPALLLAVLLGQNFLRYGWKMRPGTHNEVDGMPLPISRKDGETHATPCTEVALSYRAAEAILEQGLMPLLALRDQDVVRLARFQSIADPLSAPAGRWQG